MNIIQAIHTRVFRPLFKDPSTWAAWEVYLRALFGLGVDGEKDLALLKACTGLEEAPAAPANESFVICGRRSGKSFMSALIAAYLGAFKSWKAHLAHGEKGWIFVVAVDKQQAGIIKNYISGIFNSNATLKSMIAQETRETLELTNGVNIAVKTCSFRSIRGYTILCAILEEMAFWRSEETGANPDKEVLAAIRPALATVPDSLLIGISTPYSRQGILWDQFRQHFGKTGGPLVWRAPTRVMNPTIAEKTIETALASDRQAAKAEWEAEWRDDVSAFMPLEMIEAVVISGRYELPKVEGANYRAFCDPSGGRQDSMTLAIAHKDEKAGKILLDVLREARPPFTPESVVKEFSEALKGFGISTIRADRYAGEWVTAAFRNHEITVEASELAASAIYVNFLPLVANGTVELLDHKRLVAQLTGLERRARSGGKDIVDHYPNGHDDLAVAAAGACVLVGRGGCAIGFDDGSSYSRDDDDDNDDRNVPGVYGDALFAGVIRQGLK
ncbi:MAG: hypothetical protein ABSG19_12420 [Candidatus Aminicenantales bacterium]